MTTEELLREQLERATADVPPGPDLATTLVAGRSRRRTRTLVRTGGAVVATAAGVSLVAALSGSTTASGHAIAPSSHGPVTPRDNLGAVVPNLTDLQDWVPGTDVDQQMAATIAKDLPALPAPDDVYCSDWYHRGKMADSQCADATDWQASYTLADGHTLLVFMGYTAPYEQVSQPSVYGNDTYISEGVRTYLTTWINADGFNLTASEDVPLSGGGPSIAAGAMEGLLKDPALTFPAPARYVPRPPGSAPTEKSPF